MNTYRINELHGYAWEIAVVNAGRLLDMDKHYAITQWVYVTAMANKMQLKFDMNGEIEE